MTLTVCMMLLPVIACLLGLNHFFFFVDGYCTQAPLQSETTEVTKRLRSFCQFRSPDGKSTVRLFPGSKIYTTDCLECSCSLRGLSCCGFGSHAGVVGLPDDCMSLHDGCRDFPVKKNNKSLDCFTGKPLDIAKMAFKPHPDNFVGLDKTAKEKAATNIDTQMTGRNALFLPINIPNARDWRDVLRGVDLTQLNLPKSGSAITKLNLPPSSADWAKLNLPASALDLTKLNLPASALDLTKLNLPASGLDLTKLNLPASALDLTKLNLPASALDLTKLKLPASGVDWTKLNLPLSSLDLAKLNRAVPGLELSKLNRPLSASEILQELLTKHLPVRNAMRTIKVETKSETGKDPQTKVETFTRPLPQGLPNSWHAPVAVHPNQDVNYHAPWLPWLFVDHI